MDNTALSPEIAARIDRLVDDARDELIGFAARLVQIPTENYPPHGNELPGQEALRAEMLASGLTVDMFTPDDVPGLREHPAFFATADGRVREYANRPNVVGTLPGTGGGRSLMITGHMDTVIAGSLPWETSLPWSGAVIESKLYGRGSLDMKGGLACGLFAIRAVRQLGLPLRGDVLLESVVDEEYGGANGTLASRLRGYTPDIVICPEPTNMAVCRAHLGWLSCKITVAGGDGAGFSSQYSAETASPLDIAQELVAAVRRFSVDYPHRLPWSQPSFPEQLPVYLMQLNTGEADFAHGLGVPQQVVLNLGITTCEGMTEAMVAQGFADYLRAHLESKGMDWGQVRIEHPIRYLHPSGLPAEHPIFAAIGDVYRAGGLQAPQPETCPFACDAFISNLHFPAPTINFGPGGANIHARNEYVLVDDLVALTKRFAALIVRWCA
ncbi:M20 family metallopeptidase [Paenibacillus cymbidii]|uniref:M20 family metallopeptidase n=1 Tax=Paenibacillus cymbidii TaxID=1639034 RepID=UPI001081A06A|nr:M20/M25/M40 family metallo-hydrolase [Paenibacillus cymbidii]